jgi:hypothetical protein
MLNYTKESLPKLFIFPDTEESKLYRDKQELLTETTKNYKENGSLKDQFWEYFSSGFLTYVSCRNRLGIQITTKTCNLYQKASV